MRPSNRPRIYGVMAEFDDPTSLVAAAHRARGAGYRRMDGYTPYPIEELHEALHIHDARLTKLVLAGGVAGCVGGYGLQYWVSVIAYPVIVAGRPLHSWPAFIPVTFECTILAAALSCVLGMLALNGLPMPYHPVFNLRRFDQASRDKFFLVIQARDPRFRLGEVRDFLDSLEPREVVDVPW